MIRDLTYGMQINIHIYIPAYYYDFIPMVYLTVFNGAVLSLVQFIPFRKYIQ